jgi:hypothetical protein
MSGAPRDRKKAANPRMQLTVYQASHRSRFRFWQLCARVEGVAGPARI